MFIFNIWMTIRQARTQQGAEVPKDVPVTAKAA